MNSFVPQVRQGLLVSLWIFAALAALALAGCGKPAEIPAAQAASPPVQGGPVVQPENAATPLVVVFLGDSLTAGFGLKPEDALPEQIEAIWRSRGIDAVAVNAGVSGDTTANGLARFEWSVVAAEPDVLVVALGANDFLLGVPPDVTRSNLEGILDRARTARIPTVLVGLTPRGRPGDGSLDADFAKIYPEISEKYGVAYYPSLLGQIESDPSLLQSDGLHPTKEGVSRISAPLADFLEPVILSVERP